MKPLNLRVCFIGGVLVMSNSLLIGVSDSFAAEKGVDHRSESRNVVADEIADNYYLRYSYHDGFADYLRKNGVSKDKYKEYIRLSNKYQNSLERTSNMLDTGMYIYDEVVYTHPVIKKIYTHNYNKYNGKASSIWSDLKRESIYDEEWASKIYEESILNFADMADVFEYKFGRKPSKKNLADMKSLDSLKYALYSGYLNRELTGEDRSKIKNGSGYELLNISKENNAEYKNYIQLKNGLIKYEKGYIRLRLVHQNVRSSIKNQYGVDIFGVLNDRDMEFVYGKSVMYLDYDEKVAKKTFVEMLDVRGYLGSTGGGNSGNGGNGGTSKPDKPIGDEIVGTIPGKPSGNGTIVGGDNVKDENYDYIGRREEYDYTVPEPIPQNNKTDEYYIRMLALMEEYKKNKLDRVIVATIGEKRILTSIQTTKGRLSYPNVKMLFNQILQSVEGESVHSKKRMMALVNNKIVVITEKDKGYSLSELNEIVKDIPMKLEEVSTKSLIKDIGEMVKDKEIKENKENKENKDDKNKG